MTQLYAIDRAGAVIREFMLTMPNQRMSRALLESLVMDRGFTESTFTKAVTALMKEGHIEREGTQRHYMLTWHEDPIAVPEITRRIIKAESVKIAPGITYANPFEWAVHHCLGMTANTCPQLHDTAA